MTITPNKSDQVYSLAEIMEEIWGTPGIAEAIKQKNPSLVAELCFSKGVKDADENFFKAAGFYVDGSQDWHKPSEGLIQGQMRRAQLGLPQQAALAKSAKEGDLFAWDICLILLVTNAYGVDTRPLHNDLHKLAAHAMLGTYRRPTTKGRPKKTIRDQHIAYAILFTASAGLTPTRNETSDPNSACDLIAEELLDHGVALSYSAVETIWKRHLKAWSL